MQAPSPQTTDGAQSKLIRDWTGNIAAADTSKFVAANLVIICLYDTQVLVIFDTTVKIVIILLVLFL